MKSKIINVIMLCGLILLCSSKVKAQWQLTGNANTTATSKLGTTNDIPLRLYTNNAERIHINGNTSGLVGYVGIGTAVPATRLHVNGVITATGGTSTNWNLAYIRIGANTTNYIPKWNGTALVKGTVYDNGTNVGIGLTTPAAKLHVKGTGNLTLTNAGHFVVGTITNLNLGFDPNHIQARNNGKFSTLNINSYGGSLSVGDMFVDTSSFTYLLTATTYIAGDLSIGNTGSGSVQKVYIDGGDQDAIVVNDPVSNHVLFSQKSGPGYGIEVEKTSTTSASAAIFGHGDYTAPGVQGVSNSGEGLIGSSYSGTGVSGSSSTGDAVNGISISGNAISGTSTNAFGVYAKSTNNYAAWFEGTVYCTGTYQGSEQKLKENIQPYSNAMEALKKLEVKTYDFKTEGIYGKMKLATGRQVGIMAENFETVFPAAVRSAEFNERMTNPTMKTKGETVAFKAVNYTYLVPVLVEAVQELNAELKMQNAELKNEMQQIKSVLTEVQQKQLNEIQNTKASLAQNIPNPFNKSSVINYYVPEKFNDAQLKIYSSQGVEMKTYTIKQSGKGALTVEANTLAAGIYSYTLIVDGIAADVKQMIVTK